MSRPIEIIRFAKPVPYREMLERQRERLRAVQEDQAPPALFLLQHPPVLTVGRNYHPEHLLCPADRLKALGVDLVPCERGGDITYHGPGQLVAYPILDLRAWQCSVGWYLRSLEDVLIRLLATYSLDAERLPGFTGVWVDGAKVAAIGVGVNKWVTFHGIALNIDPNMLHFQLIVPCGIGDKPITSLKALLGAAPPFDEVQERFVRCFHSVFEQTPGIMDIMDRMDKLE
ncbi:MAG: lipoyl(octanoyl) transferase LipB [Candidatus Hydrogenedentes bacterium]|nr:lipoyl(octanoyl) transferase LipB [Candidatus Hydrogenedentota bacterium]